MTSSGRQTEALNTDLKHAYHEHAVPAGPGSQHMKKKATVRLRTRHRHEENNTHKHTSLLRWKLTCASSVSHHLRLASYWACVKVKRWRWPRGQVGLGRDSPVCFGWGLRGGSCRGCGTTVDTQDSRVGMYSMEQDDTERAPWSYKESIARRPPANQQVDHYSMTTFPTYYASGPKYLYARHPTLLFYYITHGLETRGRLGHGGGVVLHDDPAVRLLPVGEGEASARLHGGTLSTRPREGVGARVDGELVVVDLDRCRVVGNHRELGQASKEVLRSCVCVFPRGWRKRKTKPKQ